MLLRVVAPHFVAGAIYEKHNGQWRCVKVAPIIKYLLKMSPDQAGDYIRKKRWSYRWL